MEWSKGVSGSWGDDQKIWAEDGEKRRKNGANGREKDWTQTSAHNKHKYPLISMTWPVFTGAMDGSNVFDGAAYVVSDKMFSRGAG